MTKHITLLVVLISCFGTCLFAQEKTTEAAVEAIRAAFKEINSNKTYKTERFTYEIAGCVDNGSLDYYLDKQQVVKIKETGLIGDGGWDTEYYYRNGNLIFIFESLIGGPANGPIQKSEYRVYVKDGKVIRFMNGPKIIPADNKAAELTATAKKLLQVRITKDFKGALCGD
jgi:hypothetical protein